MSNIQENIFEKLNSEPKNLWKRLVIIAIVVAIAIWGSSTTQFNGVTEAGMKVARAIGRGIMHPDLALMFDFSEQGVPFMLLQTIAIAFLGTVFGAILAIPVSFLSSTNLVPKPIAYLFRALILFIRTIPSLVWALIWIRVTGPGPFCGVVTQSICSIGMVSKMYITAIENLDTGVLEALDASGCNTFRKIRVGVLPQLSGSFISTAIYRFDINIKDATVLGIVGAGGIGSPLRQAINGAKYYQVGAFLWALILLVIIIEFISTKIRSNLSQSRH